MTAITELEKRIAAVLDKMGFEYKILDMPQMPGETCVVCGKPCPDFKVNDRGYHLECMDAIKTRA
jgi:hypothetical protein